MTKNFIIGGMFLGMQLLVVLIRLRHAEEPMVKTFGDRYLQRMQRTGRFLPKLIGERV